MENEDLKSEMIIRGIYQKKGWKRFSSFICLLSRTTLSMVDVRVCIHPLETAGSEETISTCSMDLL